MTLIRKILTSYSSSGIKLRQRKFPITRLLTIFIAMVFSASIDAMTSEQKKKIAVMNAVNMILFGDDGPRTEEIDVGGLFSSPVSESAPLTTFFSEQSGDIDFCFVLSRGQASNLTLVINGVEQQGVNLPRSGENCYTIPTSQQSSQNIVEFFVTGGPQVYLSLIGIESSSQARLGLSTLTRRGWGEREVRKVLKIFAFGGHARDAQITEWANLPPATAIRQMLNFDEHNSRLSPLAPGENYTESASQHGKLTEWQNFMSSSTSHLPIPVDNRDQYGLDGYNFDDAFNRMVTVKGLNPFRQRIGFWETNYHLAVNLDASVTRAQMARYYDDIMEAHESGVPYHEVLGVAAKSAAIAMQYGHRRNIWRNGECECNYDYAREIHQLFYGIFGVNDPNHEDGTIIETGKMLTDMSVDYIQDFGFDLDVSFGTEEHHTGNLQILGQTISGFNAASKIDNLMPKSILHPESLENLPVMIISVLADDNLNEARKNQIRAAWVALGPNKDFLTFIHSYATSELFHGANQLKYLTSHERALYIANKHSLDNLEAYFGGANYNDGRAGVTVGGVISDDDAGEFFRPAHNVFGGQTSFEAAGSALAFERNYNRWTANDYRYRNAVVCDTCDLGSAWEKKWDKYLPTRAGEYRVDDVARWLWMHVVGNLDNYTALERAQLHAILGAARKAPGETYDQNHFLDFPLLVCVANDYSAKEPGGSLTLDNLLRNGVWDRYCRQGDSEDGVDGYSASEIEDLNRFYTGQQIETTPLLTSLLNQLGNEVLPLTSSDENLRKRSRERIQAAFAFIITTPFVFAEAQQ